MRRQRKWWMMWVLLAAPLVGTAWADLGCISKVARNVNPCGTILNCDPIEYDLLMHNYPDWSLDPTCTIPGLCGGQFPYGSGDDDE